ncbi:MAG: hypothetical protein GX561_07175 [Lentisphaerae bacterium]|nr:hypothetical protein [Lentisphaerota bacterium]
MKRIIVFLSLLSVILHGGDLIVFMPLEELFPGEEVEIWCCLGDRFGRDVSDLDLCYSLEYSLGSGIVRDERKVVGEIRELVDGWDLSDIQRFDLAEGCDSSVITATVRVFDADGGEIVEACEFDLNWRPGWNDVAGVDRLRRQAVVRGLRWLQLRQGLDGSWCEGGKLSYEQSASTALALWAFGNHGFGLSNRDGNPFFSCVRLGLERLCSRSERERLRVGLPNDFHRDGYGVLIGGSNGVSSYVHPIGICALMSCDADDLAVAVRSDVGDEVVETTVGAVIGNGLDLVESDFLSFGKNSWPYGRWNQDTGFDLSISGWNYVVLLVASRQGRNVDPRVIAGVNDFLSEVYDFAHREFIYLPVEYYTNTNTLDSSGIVGMLLGSEEGFGSHRGFTRYGLGYGEVLVETSRKLVDWIRRAQYSGDSYSWWSVVRGLTLLGVTHWLVDDGIYDWRYGFVDGNEVRGEGVWRKVIKGQGEPGNWAEPRIWLGSWQVTMETSLALLALSDDVVRARNDDIGDMSVAVVLPSGVSAGLVSRHLGEGVACGEGYVRHELSIPMPKSGEMVDLGYRYWLESVANPCREEVQHGGEIEWDAGGGTIASEPLGTLYVERCRDGYGIDVSCPALLNVGEELPVDVVTVFPRGEARHCVHWEGEDSEGWVELSWGGTALSLLGLEGEVNFRGCRIQVLPDIRLSKWVEVDYELCPWGIRLVDFVRGVKLRIFGLGEKSNGLIVCGKSSEFLVRVSLIDPGGDVVAIQEWDAGASEFGRDQSRSLDFASMGLVGGGYCILGEILRGAEEVVASSGVEVELLAGEHGLPDGVVRTDRSWYCVGDEAVVISEVMSLGHDVCEVSVEVFGESAIGSWQWGFDGKSVNGKLFREYRVDLRDIACGDYDVVQIVTLEDGRQVVSQYSFEVVEVAEELSGWFEESRYEVENGGDAEIAFEVDGYAGEGLGMSVYDSGGESLHVKWQCDDAGLELIEPGSYRGGLLMRGGIDVDVGEYLVLLLSGRDVEGEPRVLDLAKLSVTESDEAMLEDPDDDLDPDIVIVDPDDDLDDLDPDVVVVEPDVDLDGLDPDVDIVDPDDDLDAPEPELPGHDDKQKPSYGGGGRRIIMAEDGDKAKGGIEAIEEAAVVDKTNQADEVLSVVALPRAERRHEVRWVKGEWGGELGIRFGRIVTKDGPYLWERHAKTIDWMCEACKSDAFRPCRAASSSGGDCLYERLIRRFWVVFE